MIETYFGFAQRFRKEINAPRFSGPEQILDGARQIFPLDA